MKIKAKRNLPPATKPAMHIASQETTVTARILKIDTDMVSEKQIVEMVSRCQPVVIRYSGSKLRNLGIDPNCIT